jgi:ubiquitin-conjugating enzyme E2 G1
MARAAAPAARGLVAAAQTASSRLLAELLRNPVDGFSAGLVDDINIFEWALTIIGPPDTL